MYKELVRLFSGTDFQTLAANRDELIALRCAPSRVPDYISRWRTGLNKLASAKGVQELKKSAWGRIFW